MLKAVGRVFDVVLIVIAVIAIGIMGLRLTGNDAYVVESGSMEPTIQVGSLAIVNNKYKYEDVKKNDIIVYTKGDTRVTHRVIDVTPEGLETKGDNNDVSDGISTTKDNFSGKVITSIPKLGYLCASIFTPKGKVVLVVWIIVLCMLNLLISHVVKSIEEDKKVNVEKISEESKGTLEERNEEGVKEE